MRRPSSTLLITLVLLAVAATAAWTPAHARPREGTLWVRSNTNASAVIGSRPGMQPASGEPDSGAQKTPPQLIGRNGPFDGAEDPVVDPADGAAAWFARISMVWMARYLGVS